MVSSEFIHNFFWWRDLETTMSLMDSSRSQLSVLFLNDTNYLLEAEMGPILVGAFFNDA